MSSKSLAHDRTRFYDVLTQAQNSFWEEIAKGYPEIQTGDMSPGATDKFESACKSALDSWIEVNQPKVTQDIEPVSLVMIYINSRHFSFEAVGRNRKEAQEVLLAGWIAHRKGASPEMLAQMPGPSLDELLEVFDIEERVLSTGSFYRDREVQKIGPIERQKELPLVDYSCKEEYQADGARTKMLSAAFLVAQELVKGAPGTVAPIGMGLYWVSPLDGRMHMFSSREARLTEVSEFCKVSEIDGMSEDGLLAIADSMGSWLKAPRWTSLMYESLPDRLVESFYNQDANAVESTPRPRG